MRDNFPFYFTFLGSADIKPLLEIEKGFETFCHCLYGVLKVSKFFILDLWHHTLLK